MLPATFAVLLEGPADLAVFFLVALAVFFLVGPLVDLAAFATLALLASPAARVFAAPAFLAGPVCFPGPPTAGTGPGPGDDRAVRAGAASEARPRPRTVMAPGPGTSLDSSPVSHRTVTIRPSVAVTRPSLAGCPFVCDTSMRSPT